jgi:hypothetical protein
MRNLPRFIVKRVTERIIETTPETCVIKRTLTKAEERHILKEANQRLSDYAIGFVKINAKSGDIDADLAGSGTLVTAGSCYAILTADHVLGVLPNTGELGLVLPTRLGPQLHRCTLQMDFAQKVQIAPASNDCNGPDLGLLLLPPTDVGKLSASKTFYNLTKRRDRMLSAPLDLKVGVWFLCGMVAERTSDLTPERGFKRVKGFHGLSGAGVVSGERTAGDFDYLHFEAKYNEAYQGPESFKGFSGGGLWQVELVERDGNLEIAEVLLSGVAFFQSDIVGDVRTIFCHGRRSIYGKAYNALARA